MSPTGRQRLTALVLGALSLTALCYNWNSPPSIGFEPYERGPLDLASALGAKRFVEPRLTGGYRYVPVEEITTGEPVLKQRELLRAAANSIRRNGRPIDSESPQTAGLVALAMGKLDRSVAVLQRAATAAPRNASVLSDLAAAYLVRAAKQGSTIDLVAALEAAERAVKLRPICPEALFNRALARQRLSLTSGAVTGWQEYLEHERDPGWIREAELAIERLQAATAAELWEAAKPQLREAVRKGDEKTVTALVDRFRQEARELGEEEILGSWADLLHQGEPSRAADEIAAARAIGRALVQLSGESMLAATVTDIDQSQSDPEQRHLLAEGFIAYHQGLLLVKSRDFAEAVVLLERAHRELRKARSPFTGWIEFLLVRCAYQREAYQEAQRRARALLGRLDSEKYPVLVGRARWVLGSAQMALAKPSEALASYQFALTSFEQTGEAANVATVHSRLANAFNELGDANAAWQHRAHALPVLSRIRNEGYRVALINVALGALEAGYAHAAFVVQTEAVNLAREQINPEQIANSLINRASILSRTGLASPEIDLSEARRNCDLIQETSIRLSILADLLTIEGSAFQRKAPDKALGALDQALEMYRTSGRLILLAPTLHARATALKQLGREADAEQSLQAAIEALEEQRGSVPDAEHRADFISRTSAGEIFDSMVRLQIERERADLALEFSERRRARLLLDWLSALPEEIDTVRFRLDTWSRPRPYHELQQGIPAGAAVLVIEMLPDRLLLWVVRRDTLDLRQVMTPAARIERLVRRFEVTTDGPETTLQTAASSLHDLLITPVAPLLRDGETLIFVPEGPFDTIPFGLLFDSRRGRYLIEDRPIAIAPSLSVLAELAPMTGSQTFVQDDLLVIADPAFDRTLNPLLPALPGVQEEIRAIQEHYPRTHVVRGEAAGREAFLGGIGRYRILHFGGHALANSAKPLLSSLLLAPDPQSGDTGVLYARDLLGRPQGGTDLVVLSSCRSAGGAAQPSEGVAGLVWSLFSQGVSTVIASTREVEDRETARLFTSFYRHLAAGEPPVLALQAAQIERLSKNRSIRRASFDWGVFQIYGAVSPTDSLDGGKR